MFTPASLACLIHGVDPRTFPYHLKMAATLGDMNQNGYGYLEKMACNFAANLYEATGQGRSFEACLFRQLTKVAQWLPGLDHFVAPVFKALIKEHSDALSEQAGGEESKAAAAIPAFLLSTIGRGAMMTPQLLKTMMGGAAITGAGVGALGWGLNRDSTADELDTEAMREKLRHYRKITNEISDDLKRNNAVDMPEHPANVIARDAHTDHVTF